jgi:hypothetical protein
MDMDIDVDMMETVERALLNEKWYREMEVLDDVPILLSSLDSRVNLPPLRKDYLHLIQHSAVVLDSSRMPVYRPFTGQGYNPLVKETSWNEVIQFLHSKDEHGIVTWVLLLFATRAIGTSSTDDQ